MKKSQVRLLRAKRLATEKRLNEISFVVCCKYPEVIEFLETQKQSENASRIYARAWSELTQAQREELIPEFFIDSVYYIPEGIAMPRRDMSRKEFNAALKRRGFEIVCHDRIGEVGIKISDTCTVGIVMLRRKKESVMHHRETLKRAIEIAGGRSS